MTQEYEEIEERLLLILRSQKTISFYKEHFGKIPISGSTPILNLIIEELFTNEKNIEFINYNRINSKINDIIIHDKKILIRLHAFNSLSKKFSFKYFYIQNLDDEDLIEYVIDEVNREIDSYDYIFLIRAEEQEAIKNKEKKFKSCYHYYLIPIDYYKIDEEEKEEKIKQHKKRLEEYKEKIKSQVDYKINHCYIGKKWDFCNFNKFFFRYNIGMLDSYYIGSPYVNC